MHFINEVGACQPSANGCLKLDLDGALNEIERPELSLSQIVTQSVKLL